MTSTPVSTPTPLPGSPLKIRSLNQLSPYHLTKPRFWLIIAILTIILAIVATGALLTGSESISLAQALRDPTSVDRVILLQIRFPRILTGIITGAALSVCGAALQAMLRNPLADPYVFGVSGGAALGGTLITSLLAAVTAATGMTAMTLSLGASFAGALAAAWLTARLAMTAGRVQVYQALLAGVVVNSFAAAAVTILKLMVSAEKAQQILMWMMGTLAVESIPFPSLAICLAVSAIASLLLIGGARKFNLLLLGHDQSFSTGLDSDKFARRVIVTTAAAVGAATAVTGLIGFVGLVVPHWAKALVGQDHRMAMPAAAIMGGILLTVCDLAGRLLFSLLGTELPVGAFTALIGGPAFIHIIHKAGLQESGAVK